MASTEERIRQLGEERLGRPLNVDARPADSGVSSLEVVTFIKAVGDAFNITIPPGEVANFSNLRDLINYVDSRTG